jgi:hypothetical protein
VARSPFPYDSIAAFTQPNTKSVKLVLARSRWPPRRDHRVEFSRGLPGTSGTCGLDRRRDLQGDQAAALHPLVWITDHHAFAGFFVREDRLPETISLEPNQMINIVEQRRGFPSTSLQTSQPPSAQVTHLLG